MNSAAACAMTQIGEHLCVKSLQVPSMHPQLVGNLKHTHPKSWGCEQTHRNALALQRRGILPVQVLLSLQNISAPIVEDVKRLEVRKNLRRN